MFCFKNNSKKFFLFLFFLLIIFLFFWGCSKEEKKISKSFYSLGTFVEITVYEKNNQKAETSINKVLEKIKDFSDKVTIFDEKSEISQVNREASKKPVKVSPEVFELLKEALKFSKLTDGAFDITVGPLVELWGFNNKKIKWPLPEEIEKTLESVGSEKIVLDEKNQTVFLKKQGMKIDLGGIAKGYAADLAAKILRKEGINSALVNAGGNIIAIGAPPGKNFWIIGIKHPRKKDLIGKICLKDMAVATSGDYENYFVKNKRRFSHIINPLTGYPGEKGVISTTVVSKDAITTDALSTAVFVKGVSEGKKLIKKFPETYSLIIFEDKKFPEKLNYFLTEDSEKFFNLFRN